MKCRSNLSPSRTARPQKTTRIALFPVGQGSWFCGDGSNCAAIKREVIRLTSFKEDEQRM
ncbi:hypothetical protein BC938DRAFT_477129 [Jimgerdemannia flammicorona]|uniref:Uncharacterized protein n=1 Tax=Jimgerdemannia flammicorona TaxID=994334 RepID=A0A433PBU9_9FUNG|nr:hypothetical protein BC938DRAFT_477129 [Jimgerdemannia flammicorona]